MTKMEDSLSISLPGVECRFIKDGKVYFKISE